MPRVLLSKLLPNKNMPQMSTTVCALDFRSHPIRIRKPLYCAGDFVVKAWPAAVCLKLMLGTVQFGSATSADISALFPESIVFAGEWHLRVLVNYDLLFFRSELLEFSLFLRS